MLSGQDLAFVLYGVQLGQSLLLNVVIEGLCVSLELGETLLSVEGTVNSAKLPNRVRCQLVPFTIMELGDALIVRPGQNVYPVDLGVGEHLCLWALDISLKIVAVVVSIPERLIIGFYLSRQ